MRRILHIINSLGRSGTTEQLRLLAHGLAQNSYDVHIGVLGPKPARPVQFDSAPRDARIHFAATLAIHYLGRRLPLDPVADVRLVQLVHRLQPEIVHTWNSVPGMFGPIALRYVRRFSAGGASPRIFVSWNHIDCCQPEWETWVERGFARHAAGYITSSPIVREWCTARGLPAEKFTVVPPGVPPARASDVSREELLRQLRLPRDARLIGVIGRLVPEKRVRDLIWAADLLRVLHDNLRRRWPPVSRSLPATCLLIASWWYTAKPAT
jgi:glycosyltransferase involved in cell wall biosynthesis